MTRRFALFAALAMLTAALSGCVSSVSEIVNSIQETQKSEETPYIETYSFENFFSGGWEGGVGEGTFPVKQLKPERILVEMNYSDQLPIDGNLYIRIYAPDGAKYESEKDGGSYEKIELTDRAMLERSTGDWDVYMRVAGPVARTSYVITAKVFYEDYHESRIYSEQESAAETGAPKFVDLRGKSHVVVAVIDSGINAYHEIFRRPGMTMHPSEYIEGFPKSARALDLTFSGTYEECRKTDEKLWNGIGVGELCTIPGTNIIGAICIDQRADPPEESSIIDEGSHGTATSSLIARNCPDALIVMVQWKYGTLGSAVKWAAEQPWIDILSVSMGYPANLPPIYDSSWKEIMAAQETEKLIFFAAGNDPTLSITDPFSGPPCVISIGGVENDTHGETLMASKIVDFVSEFTTSVAKHNDRKGEYVGSGTSFACPIAAGTAAQILLNVRRTANYTGIIKEGSLVVGAGEGVLSDGKVTNGEFRDLLNRTAVYWNTTDYGTYGIGVGSIPYGVNAPILPTPWIQMGWGYLNSEIVESATCVALGKAQPPEKLLASEYMSAMQTIRTAYWQIVGITG
ncbi:MAG: S8 family serine peptidase [Candidatus Thermoplasmatota archaeon]|nr:S8 family serine peptidase [Candidatus Thermoplasmatota archaeon]